MTRLGAPAASLLTAGCATLWGLSFLVNDLGLDVLHPATFALWRMVVAAAASVGVALAFRSFDARIFREPLLWGWAALNAAAFLLQYAGQTLTTPGRAALFVNANALVTALLAWIFLRERPRGATWGPLALALAGVVALQWDPALLASGVALGDLVVFLGGVGFGAFIVLGKRFAEKDALALAAALWPATALAILPAALVLAPAESLVPAREGWWAIVVSGLVTTSLAYTLWSFALRSLTATASAVILLLEVLVAVAAGVLAGREVVTVNAALGGALLFAGVAWISVSSARASARP